MEAGLLGGAGRCCALGALLPSADGTQRPVDKGLDVVSAHEAGQNYRRIWGEKRSGELPGGGELAA